MADLAFADAESVTLEYDNDRLSYYVFEDPDSGLLQLRPGVADEVPEQRREGPLSYESLPADLSGLIASESWALGAGFSTLADSPSANAARFAGYSHSQGVDASWETELYVSPERQSTTTLAAAVTGRYNSPTFGPLLWAGANLYQWASGAWNLRKTFGAAITDVIEYGNSVDTYLFAALGDATDMQNSVSATLASFTVVTGEAQAYFAVRGQTSMEPTMYGVTTTGILRASNAPILAANWSNKVQIGHRGEVTSKMVVANDVVIVLKESGLYTFDGTSASDRLPVDALTESGNGKYAVVWVDGRVYFNFANRIIAFDPDDNSLETVFNPGHPEINGSITAMDADTTALYVGVTNAAGNTYILRGNPTTALHTWVYPGANACGGLMVLPAGALHATNPVVVAGYGATGSGYYILPRAGLRPRDDANCRFDTAGGTLFGTRNHANTLLFPKLLSSLKALVRSATAAQRVLFNYQLDEDTTTQTGPVITTNGLTTQDAVTEVSFTEIRYSVTMNTGANTGSPRVQGLIFDTTPNAPRRRTWDALVYIGPAPTAAPKAGTTYRKHEAHLLRAVGRRVTFHDLLGNEYFVKVRRVSSLGYRRVITGAGRSNVVAIYQISMAELTSL